MARRALWWFRWAALATVLTGILITGVTKDYYKNDFFKPADGHGDRPPACSSASIMLANVWGVIWRNQKVVLANAANVLGGGTADPAAAGGGPRRPCMASRQNTIFSVRDAVVHGRHARTGPLIGDKPGGGKVAAYWIITLIIIAVLEVNALGLMPWKREANKGLNVLYDGPTTSPRNPIIAAFGLWVVFLILTRDLLPGLTTAVS